MVAETARSFDALEAQASVLMQVFKGAGFEHVAPAIIQPADVFLDVIGEALRGRTYVFTDPDGEELCLRPDITVPTCRLYLERHPAADRKAKYCYNGPAFRFQPGGVTESHPREFRQAGIESFGDTAKVKAEVEVFALALEALGKAGLKAFRVRLGDLGIMRALLDAIEMPERWRRRLAASFWRQEAFRSELMRLGGQAPWPVPDGTGDLLARLTPDDQEANEASVAAFLAGQGIEIVGNRTVAEVAANLAELAADLGEKPLGAPVIALIDDCLGVKGPPRVAGARLKDLTRERHIDLEAAIEGYMQRLDRLAKTGIDWSETEFSAQFGRDLEYYTGFVFQVEVALFGARGHLAGGGRYDSLLGDIGAPAEVPGVGLAIHTERLLYAISEGL
ncbi:MAG: ATP phosphoribosyltransferase regulatory subunit [Rhizobiales bacterium]|nr:ATP phosphoribosyltransferase regulatory subunit [Hyphomicrobiales bacterium]